MAETFELEIATPERLVVREPVREAQVPAAAGYLGLLPGHAPLIGELGSGELAFEKPDGTWLRLVVGGGFLEVRPERVVVLADAADWPAEIDPARAQYALERAEEQERSTDPATDYSSATHKVRLARARLAARERYTREQAGGGE